MVANPCWSDTGSGVNTLRGGEVVLLGIIDFLCVGFMLYSTSLRTGVVVELGSCCPGEKNAILDIAARCINSIIYLLPSLWVGLQGLGSGRC